MPAQIAALTNRGQKRSVNEDTVLAEELPDGSILLAVADGVGGLSHGTVASTEAVRVLRDEIGRASLDDPPTVMKDAFSLANQRVHALGQQEEGQSAMASTLVAAFVRDGRAWLANVGDSRAYLLHESRLQQLTQDHSLVAEQIRAGVIQPEEADSVTYGNLITRAIGVEETIEADATGPHQLAPSTLLLLCSDGLYRMLHDSEIAEVLSTGDPQAMAERLVQRANDEGGPDNISVVILRSEE